MNCSRYQTIETDIFKNRDFSIQLVDELAPGGIPLKKGFYHPQKISTKDFSIEMGRLTYNDAIVLWKEKERPIFSEEEIQILAPHMVKALEKANSDQMIKFFSKSMKKDSVFVAEKLNSGFFFLYQNQINWVFGNINQSTGQEGEIFYGNPLHKVPAATEVALQEGQTYHRPKTRKWYEPKIHSNWIVGATPFQLAPPASKPGTPPPMGKVPHPEKIQKFEENIKGRLRQLKSLRDENLISEEDYKRKKVEILKDL